MSTSDEQIYDPDFVRDVFDRCGPNYRNWSAVASFGFVRRWRKQCVSALPIDTAEYAVCFDLMAGTGEVWPHLLRRFPDLAHIKAVDISHVMHLEALDRLHASRSEHIEHLEANVLDGGLPESAADIVISTFGLKTFNEAQLAVLAGEVARVLKPGGVFSLIEASDPTQWNLRGLYRFYMDGVLPLIERLFLRGAQDFAMIGTYTKNFQNAAYFADCLRKEGLEVDYRTYFFGCATGVSGRKTI